MLYDRSGVPIDSLRWTRLNQDETYRCLARTQVNDRYLVHTVWLGIERFDGDQVSPLLFETTVLHRVKDNGPVEVGAFAYDGALWAEDSRFEGRRYHCESAAREGHIAVIRELGERNSIVNDL